MKESYMLIINNDKLFWDFYANNFEKLLKFLSFNYPNLNDPESHLQDVCIRFFELYYKKWDSTKSELQTYFTNYLKMCTLNKIKENNKKQTISLDVEYQIGSKIATLKDILVQDNSNNGIDDKLNILNIIIKRLEKKWIDRFDLLMLHYKGMSYNEIAEYKSITLSQVKNDIRITRIYFCDEYTKLTGNKLEYKKESQIGSASFNNKARIKNTEIRKTSLKKNKKEA